MESLPRICRYCQELIPASRRVVAIYCSDDCNHRASYSRHKDRTLSQAKHLRDTAKAGKICLHCSQPVATHKRSDAKYCSEQCASKFYRNANQQDLKEYRRSYRAANKESCYINETRWRRNNPDKTKINRDKYRAKKPFSRYIQNLRRRNRRRKNGHFLVTEKDLRKLFLRYNFSCAYCLKPSDNLQIDHIIPVSKGGRDSIGNYAPACRQCNQSKNASFITVWLKREKLINSSRQTKS